MQSLSPTVAVIMPSYNRWPHVCDAIESVLRQSWTNTECWVVDDASEDGTSQNVRRRYGDRVRLLTLEKHGEKSRARNMGIRASGADYLCMLDSDDVLTPDSIQSRIRIFIESPQFDGVVYGLFSRDGKTKPPLPVDDNTAALLSLYVRQPFIHNNAYMLSRKTMLEVGMYREELTHLEDIELLVRLLCRLPFRFCGACVVCNRKLGNSARDNFSAIIAQGRAMTARLRGDEAVIERAGNELDYLEFREMQELARAFYRSGRMRELRECYREMKRRWPDRSHTWSLRKHYLFSFVSPLFIRLRSARLTPKTRIEGRGLG